MKKVFTLVLALVMMVSLLGCGDSSTPANDGKDAGEPPAGTGAQTGTEENTEGKTVAFLVKNMNNSFWIEMVDAAQKQCDEYGWTLQVLAPIDTDSNEQQIQLLEQSLVNPPDLYVIIPTDSVGIVPAIEEINEAGIPIINLNTQIVGDVEKVTFLSCENYLLGYNVAKAGAELVGNEGKVVMLAGVPGSQSFNERLEGGRDAYTEAGMEIIDEQIANNDRSEGYTVTQALLQKYDDIRVVFSCNGEMALGASVAVSEADRSGQISIQTVDCYDEIVSSINDGNIQICINNAGDIQGKGAIQLAMDYFKGKEIGEVSAIDAETITIDNIAPYLEKYNLE